MAETHLVVVPRETVNDDFVVLLRWLVPDRSPVKAGDAVAEIETSKAAVMIEAEHDGYLLQTAKALDRIEVGAELGSIVAELPAATPTVSTTALAATGEAVPTTFSKRAEELIRERGLDRALFRDKPLVREQDVLELLAARDAVSSNLRRGRAAIAESIALSPHKRTEVRYLSQVNASGLVSAVTRLVPTEGIDLQIEAAASERRMSYLDFVLPAAARALSQHRELNAYFADEQIHYYSETNIGVAFNLGQGLLVPVLRSAAEKSPQEVSRWMGEVSMKYIRKELTEQDLSGGTFTITDLGGAGAFQVMPLVNREQSAILAMGKGDGHLVLTLAFDHRVSEGQQAAELLSAIADEICEAPRAEEQACTNCLRTLGDLERLRAFLLPIASRQRGDRYVCSICLMGWNG